MKSSPNPTSRCWLVLRILHPVADWRSMKSSPNPTPCCWLALRILHHVADWSSMKSSPNPTPHCWLALRSLHPVADWLSESYTPLLTGSPHTTPRCWLAVDGCYHGSGDLHGTTLTRPTARDSRFVAAQGEKREHCSDAARWAPWSTVSYTASHPNSKHSFTTSFLQPLPYLVTP